MLVGINFYKTEHMTNIQLYGHQKINRYLSAKSFINGTVGAVVKRLAFCVTCREFDFRMEYIVVWLIDRVSESGVCI